MTTANHPPRNEPGRLAAAIDVGTNTVLLLVGRLDVRGQLAVVDDRCETPRLGTGVAAHGTLDPDAMQRTLDVLRGYIARTDELAVPRERVRAVGTAVFRRARDAGAFVERVRKELDLALEVASEEEEARLSYQAVVGDGAARATLVVDVGGGSTEFVTDGGARRYSAPVGAVVLTETYSRDADDPALKAVALGTHGAHDTVDPMRDAVRRACEVFPAGAARSKAELHRSGGRDDPDDPRDPDDLRATSGATGASETGEPEVVALGGTSLNLAALVLGLERFDHVRTEGTRVAAAAVARWSRRLVAMTPAEIERLPIEPARRAILPAGIVCLDEALRRIEAKEVRLSGRGLRYGILRELLSAGG